MGIDSLTHPRRAPCVNLAREPVVTVSFHQKETREMTSCRGDGQILEEATLNGGRFTGDLHPALGLPAADGHRNFQPLSIARPSRYLAPPSISPPRSSSSAPWCMPRPWP